MDSHSLERTSPYGEKFVGFCTKCGKRDLTFSDAQREDCPDPGGLTQDDALMLAIEGDATPPASVPA